MIVGGCAARERLLPAYVDAQRLARLHPAQPELEALGGMIAQVRSDLRRLQRGQPLPLPPSRVPMPPAPALPLPSMPVREAVASARAAAGADLARLEQEIRRGAEERIARRQAELETTVRLDIARQRARLDEQLWQEKLQITRPRRQELTNLELEVANLRRVLASGGVLPGQEQPMRNELQQAESRLAALRTELDRRIGELETGYAERLDQFARQARAQAEQEAARYRREQLQQVETLITQAHQRMEQGLSAVASSAGQVVGVSPGPAPVLDLSHIRSQLAAAQQTARRDRAQGIAALRAELEKLQRQRQTLAQAIARDTRETTTAIMRSRGVRVSFNPVAARLMRDRTAQALQALHAFWGPAAAERG